MIPHLVVFLNKPGMDSLMKKPVMPHWITTINIINQQESLYF